MGKRYRSIDTLQKALGEGAFSYAADRKKAAGRALGTFVELITCYLLKSWGLERYLAIERGLPEFADPSIAHNVEFTLHRSRPIATVKFDSDSGYTARRIIKSADCQLDGKATSNLLLSSDGLLKNACTVLEGDTHFVNAYLSDKCTVSVCELDRHPFAMFECKRVGVEEGQKKDPQTIEKAKQGAYVARTVSSLQRVRLQDGTIAGFMERPDGSFACEEYYGLLNKIASGDDPRLLKNFTLTVGVVSNHGNWFTAENRNKELDVLAQSYDWLLFLTDEGLATFIEDVLFSGKKVTSACRKAFYDSYSKEKRGNHFTKSKIDAAANAELMAYFVSMRKSISKWFNVITPKQSGLDALKNQLFGLVGTEDAP